MAKYRVQLKQGSRTIVNHVEAKNVGAILSFFNSLTTMQVSEVLKVEFSDDTMPPMDDFAYYSVFKGIMYTETRLAKQIILNNVKLSISEKEIANACTQFLEIENANVKSLYSALFKMKSI